MNNPVQVSDPEREAILSGREESLRLYYEQKDGCRTHPYPAGKICVDCVSDALGRAFMQGWQARAALKETK
jgi:hypothetical protein